MKVSVLVPIYNAEKTLERCINSILNQSFKDIEVICVNDGSSDRSDEIIEKFQKEDNRVIKINKENGGYGSAMNIALKNAKGKYISIVDSDDYILDGMFDHFVNLADENDLDFIRGAYYQFIVGKDGKEKRKYFSSMGNKYIDIVYCPRETSDFYFSAVLTPSGIYNRDFLLKNNITWDENKNITFEDQGFWFKTHLYANRVLFVRDAYYMYKMDNPNSSIYSKDKLQKMKKEYELIYQYIQQNTKYLSISNCFYWKAFYLALLVVYERDYRAINYENTKYLRECFIDANIDTSLFNSIQLKSFNIFINDLKKFTKDLKKKSLIKAYNNYIFFNDIDDNFSNKFKWYLNNTNFNIFIYIIFNNFIKKIFKIYSLSKSFCIKNVNNILNRLPIIKSFANLSVTLKNNINKQNNLNDRDDYLFWINYRKENESIVECKKRFFYSMPKAEGSLRDRQIDYTDVLKELKFHLDKANLPFWPMGGTLIGTIRHQGFIPWDDDIDISMMYEDKEKLFEVINNSKTLKIYEAYWCEKNKILRCPRVAFKDINRKGFIDIFLWERSGFEGSGFIATWKKRNQVVSNLNKEYVQIKRKLNRLYINEGVYDEHDQVILDDLFKRHREDCLRKIPSTGTSIYGSIDMWFQAGTWNSVYKYEDVFPLVEAKFENIDIKIPKNSEKMILDQYKSDYLTLPQKVKPAHGG